MLIDIILLVTSLFQFPSSNLYYANVQMSGVGIRNITFCQTSKIVNDYIELHYSEAWTVM